MRKTFALILLLSSGAAHAAGTYVMTGYVQGYNGFAPNGSNLTGGLIPAGGICTVDAGANVNCTGVQFSVVGASTTFNYTNGNWSTSVGGTAITHSETCIESAGASCTNGASGLLGIWATGLRSDGGPSNTCSASNFFAAGLCDQVSVTEVEGVSLRIIEQSEFAFAGTASGYIYTFSAVPVPAAAWLFSGALLAAGVWRRGLRVVRVV